MLFHYSVMKILEIGIGLYFGNASTCPTSPRDDQFENFCEQLRTLLGVRGLVLEQQVHGTQGRLIGQCLDGCSLFEHQGDYLATRQKDLALGVLTADCLPIIFYNPERKALAVAHAGWKGSVAGIAVKTLQRLVAELGADPASTKVFFGPSAGVCCYQVQQDFCDQLEKDGHRETLALVKRNGKTYFDNVLFNCIELVNAGVRPENITDQFNLCTVCTPGFHSFRLQGASAGRQITCAWILDEARAL